MKGTKAEEEEGIYLTNLELFIDPVLLILKKNILQWGTFVGVAG